MSEHEDKGSGLGRGWLAAAVLVAVVAAGLVWVLLRGSSGPSTAAPPASTTYSPATSAPPPSSPVAPAATPGPPPAPSAAGETWPDPGCNGTTGSAGPPQSVMTDVRWEPFLSAAVPVSPTLGPAKRATPLRQCFQHSPAGALLAAANIQYAAIAPDAGAAVVRAQYTPGPGQDKALIDLKTSSGQPGNIAAFRLAGCTPSQCNVELIGFGRGLYADGVIPLVWHDGDWLVDGSHVVPDAGLVQGIPAGFTAWAATS